MLSQDLLDILVCPQCKGELQYRPEAQQLVCYQCHLIYHIEDDIPIMLVEEAEKF